MSHMQKRVTEFMEFIEIEGNNGTTYIPTDYVHPELIALAQIGWNKTGEQDYAANEQAAKHYDGKVHMVTICEGYGARMSAPGYMDCDDWTVYPTEEEAYAALEDRYSYAVAA